MPSNDPRPTKAQRQADARARAAELRRQQEQASRRNRFLAIGGSILAVLVIVGAITLVLVQNRQNAAKYADAAFGGSDSDSTSLVIPALADVQAPSTANDSGGIPVSAAGVGTAGDGDTVVQLYFDMQCPVCKSFDAVNSGDLQALSQEAGVTVVYQPLSFLDTYSQGTHYSNRAANALMTVADQDPDHFEAFMTALYTDQPAENSKGLTDDEIGEIALGVDVPQTVVDQFTSTVSGTYTVGSEQRTGQWRVFAPFVASATSYANTNFGGLSTPTLVIDGTIVSGGPDNVSDVDWTTAGAVKAAVEAAVAAKQ
jgi:protein-disulfide isomerase